MKKTLTIGLLAAASALTAWAGTPVMMNTAPTSAPVESLYGPGWVFSPYAMFLTPDADLADDVWGGGIAAHYFFNEWVGLGAFGQWADVSDEVGGAYAAELVLRYPVGTYFAPYVSAAGGVQDYFDSEIFGQAGAGLEVKFTPRFGLFGEWDYVFPGGGGGDDDFEDYQTVRFGARISF